MRTQALVVLAMTASVAQAQETPAALPLRDVVLFSSGVGYFGRAGQIAGEADVPLSFRAEQVNDILKSLVVFDAAGAVRPVTYTAKDPISRQLRPAGRAIRPDITLADLLRHFPGARVRLIARGEIIEGRILSVSTKSVPAPPEPGEGAPPLLVPRPLVPVDILNLMTADGLRSVSLGQVSRIRLLDERLDRELRESLELLATGLDDERRTVQLHFGRGGARQVRAGYLQETPVWKTSYRLVLDKGARPYLQGWGIVENTTDEDWKDVRLSLVSGRPISFIQDLYQPLYVPRPTVASQVIGSPLPQTYGETLEGDKDDDRAAGEKAAPPPSARPRPAPATPGSAGGGRAGGGFGGGGGGGGGGFGGRLNEEMARDIGVSAAQLAQSGAQAAGTERGDLFEYAITQPVNLPRQQAALVPIISENIDGEPVSIFDPASDAEWALNGFRLKNSTGLHLAGGPITVFAGGVYAGDAQIGNVQPGEERYLAYAVDLDLVANRETPTVNEDILAIMARSGVLNITRKQRVETTYTFRNKAAAPKNVVVQQPIDPNFALVEPKDKPAQTATQYRFRVTVPAGGNATFKTVSERPVTQTVALFDMNLDMLVYYTRNAKASDKLRAALEELATRRRKITDLQAQRALRETERNEIGQEQARIRQNMAELNRDSALYQKYATKLSVQEDRLEKLKEDIATLRDQEAETQRALRAYVDSLTID